MENAGVTVGRPVHPMSELLDDPTYIISVLTDAYKEQITYGELTPVVLLCRAAYHGDVEHVSHYLAVCRVQESEGALRDAAGQALLCAACQGRTDVAALLKHGASDDDRSMALRIAVAQGHDGVADLLRRQERGRVHA